MEFSCKRCKSNDQSWSQNVPSVSSQDEVGYFPNVPSISSQGEVGCIVANAVCIHTICLQSGQNRTIFIVVIKDSHVSNLAQPGFGTHTQARGQFLG